MLGGHYYFGGDNGWKNTFKLFEDPLFNPLYQQAQQCFHHTLAQMGADLALRFQLEGSVNITDVGGYNQHHGHAQNMLSGCYYLSVPEYSGGIEFHEPRLGAKYSPFQPKSLYGSQFVSCSAARRAVNYFSVLVGAFCSRKSVYTESLLYPNELKTSSTCVIEMLTVKKRDRL